MVCRVPKTYRPVVYCNLVQGLVKETSPGQIRLNPAC